MNKKEIFALFLILLFSCTPASRDITCSFPPLRLQLIYQGSWDCDARHLLFSTLDDTLYMLNTLNGDLAWRKWDGNSFEKKAIQSLPVGIHNGEIFNPVSLLPLTSQSFLIFDRYKNRIHLADSHCIRKTLTIKEPGIFPPGAHLSSRISSSAGAVLFISFRGKGEILCVNTSPFQIHDFKGITHSLSPDSRKEIMVNDYAGDLLFCSGVSYRLFRKPALYCQNDSTVSFLSFFLKDINKYGYSFRIPSHKSAVSPLSPFSKRITRVALLPSGRHKKGRLLFFDDENGRIFLYDLHTGGITNTYSIEIPSEIFMKEPNLIFLGKRHLLFYGENSSFYLYEIIG